MSTIEKAFDLLGYFSIDRPEIGLTEFRSLANRDKATTYRHLSALESVGLIEQNPDTRRYRIGAAVLRLAHLREVTTPRRAGVRIVLPRLAEATGETAHASLLEGAELMTLAYHVSSAHSTRVVIHDAELPLHATASGIAVLGFADESLLAAARKKQVRYTDHTAADAEALDALIEAARSSGFGTSNEGFEAGVHGIATPLFDPSGRVAGAVAVASIAMRMNPELEQTIRRELRKAAREITQSWGGTIPDRLEQAWARSLS